MTTGYPPPAAPASRRNLWLGLGGCAVLLCCGLLVAAVVGVYFWLSPTRVVTTGEQPAVEYILDASPRMGLPAQGGDSGTRLSVAQGVLAEIVRPAKSDLTAGLRVFGTGVIPEACRDTELLVPLTQANQAEISNRLLALEVGGSADAAMAEAMVNAIRELDAVTGPHSLVVVTGGTDSCNPEAGALIADEAEKAGISLRLYVVGYQVPPEEAESLKGLIDESGGDYFDAQDAGDLESILKAIQNYIDNPQALTPMEFLGTPVAQGVTAQPLATGAAGDTPAPADTPAPEATPAEQPTQPEAQPTLGPTGDDIGAYQSQTACDHPYFPLREGATWTFSSESGPQTWTVTSVSGDETNATADMAIDMAEVSVTYHWTCSPEGIVSYDFGNISVPGAEGGGFTYEVSNESGVWLPPATQLEEGAAWDNSYTMVMTVDVAGQSIQSTNTVQQTNTAAVAEDVEVPAGSFRAVVVNTASSMNISMPGIASIASESTSTYYLGFGVGLLRWESASEGGAYTSALQSYSIP